MEGGGSKQGPVTCGSWIRRPDKVNLVVLGKSSGGGSSPSVLEIFSFDPKTASLSSSPLTTYVLEQVDGDPVSIAVHPSRDDIVCSTTNGGCKLFELFENQAQGCWPRNYLLSKVLVCRNAYLLVLMDPNLLLVGWMGISESWSGQAFVLF